MGSLRPVLELGPGLACASSGGHAVAWVRLSKIEYYLPDNVSYSRLSDLAHAVNDKARRGMRPLKTGSGEFPRPRYVQRADASLQHRAPVKSFSGSRI